MVAMSLRGSTIVRMLARVDAGDPDAGGIDVSTEFIIEVRSPTGRRWDYSSGPGISALEPEAGDLKQRFDWFARDHFGDLLRDLRADGYDGTDPPPGYAITWDVTSAALAVQRRADL